MTQPVKMKADPMARALASWGNPPEWVLVLAEACNKLSQSQIAGKLGYSPATVSQVLSNSYQNGDIGKFEQIVRGVLMSETVPCPRLGDLSRNACVAWQGKPFDPTNAQRVRMYHSCRSGCEFSRLKSEVDHD